MSKSFGKKKKVTSSEFISSDEDADTETNQPPKKRTKAEKSEKREKTREPQLEFDLEKKRKVRISEFKGKWRVDIREFYEDDGELKPGRKGISLSLEQWEKLVSLIPDITESLESVK